MKKIIELKLKFLAKAVLRKYKPEVVGITGSVGKTSTKEAVFAILKKKQRVRRSVKNYNNEIGVPLTILGCESPGKNLLGWLFVFLRGVALVLRRNKNYPELLVLEMGVDRPGDMDYLNSIVKCDIGILTFVGTVHAEYFKNRDGIRKEKTKLIKNINKNGYAIINYDNEISRRAIKDSSVKTLSYGLDEKADTRAIEIKYSYKGEEVADNIQGISFKLSHSGSVAPMLIPGVLGIGAVYSALAGVAAGIARGMNLIEIAEALRGMESPRGRMRLIKGIKNTTIIDDTYNAEPDSTLAALGALRRIIVKESARKVAVLGDMLELGSYSETGHSNIGKYIAKSKIEKLVVVGERARDIARGAQEGGMSRDNIFTFPASLEAGKFVQDRIQEGDLILVKGSQGMRMEKIVLEIMAEPLKAKELLVRQEKSWQKK